MSGDIKKEKTKGCKEVHMGGQLGCDYLRAIPPDIEKT